MHNAVGLERNCRRISDLFSRQNTRSHKMTVEEQQQIETTNHNSVGGGPPQAHLRGATFLPLILVALVLGYLIYSGIKARAEASTNLEAETQRSAVPSVSVIYPKESAPTEEVVLPGNTQAFTDTPIYARTSGYLQRWYVDIGARVKAGQLLADIETPEVDQQLQQARADLQTAQANLALAKSTAEQLAVSCKDRLRLQTGNG